MALRAGDKLGPYEILAPLGSGGMGAVWKARDAKLSRFVAIKVLREEGGDHARLVQEARAAAQLNHPNIVTIHEIGEQDDTVFVVMELIDGRRLNECSGKTGLAIKDALKYAIAIARALEAAHRRGIIHRDLKPQNVMVTHAGDVKLLDFGLAKIRPVEASGSIEPTATLDQFPSTGTGQILGTIAYMSPEQAQGKPLDTRSDIFSFGTVFYEMLTGHRPFQGQDNVSILASILRDEPAPPSQVVTSLIPPEAERIVLRCLRKDPERRFQTASDLRAALDDLQEELATGRVDTASVPPVRPVRRLWWVAASTVAGAVVVLAVVLWWTLRAPKTAEHGAVQQVTFDIGITFTPAISPDGRLLAFASDRAEPRNLDIWLRQMAGGGLSRLTTLPGTEYNPQFSPDGTRIYYLSGDRSIFEIPTLGGPARKVIDNAGPFTISSKGEIAYARSVLAARPEPVMIASTDGGTPEPWQPDCRSLPRPTWSPDGSRIFFVGDCGPKQHSGFVAPRRGGTAQAIVDVPETSYLGPAPAWFRLGSGLEGILYGARGPERGIHLFRIDPRSPAAPLTMSGVSQQWPAVSPAGELIFTQFEPRNSVWSLPMGERGVTADQIPTSVVDGVGHYSVSRDEKTLVYGRLTGGAAGELVVKNLTTGEQRVFAEHQLLGVSIGSIWPQVSPDGQKVIYRVIGTQGGHYLLRLDTGAVRRVTPMEQLQLASDWSPDGKRVIGECPPPRFGICELDPESGAVKTMKVHETDQLLYPSWSWDARSVVFSRRKPGGLAAIWIAPVSPDGVISPEEKWVGISQAETDNSRPRFGPDGATVFYIMGRAGERLLVAQKINKATHQPIGDPLRLVRAPVELTSITSGAGPYPLITVTANRLYYSVIGITGNLWMTRVD